MSFFSDTGIKFFQDFILGPLRRIQGSYFGMLQGKWPMHLLSDRPLPSRMFNEDSIRCRVYCYENSNWAFSPVNVDEDSQNWFRLEFNLPYNIAILVQDSAGDPAKLANTKRAHFSFISLSGVIGGVRRQIRLKLDEEWLDSYLERVLGGFNGK